MKKIILPTILVFFLLSDNGLKAQAPEPSMKSGLTENKSTSHLNQADAKDNLAIANEYILSHLKELGLTPSDIAGMTVNDMYTDKSSGITRIYFLQRYHALEVYNAILNVCITKEGNVYYVTNRFVNDLEKKINTTTPIISPGKAVTNLAAHLGLTSSRMRIKQSTGDTQFVFEKDSLANEDITTGLSYQPHDGKVNLAWDVFMCPRGTHDQWNARVDAVTGAVLDKNNWTLYCKVDGNTYRREENDCYELPEYKNVNTDPAFPGEQYNVWPAPIASPDFGPRTMVTNPADPIASPYGWHDINGQPGAEYYITAGNNVHAYQDTTDSGISSGDEPSGGPNLHFDFPYVSSWEPRQYTDAATVNLFYWINFMHDFSYHFGFDEAAGNFQKNNYGRGGLGNDFVWAVSQDGSATDSIYNNAEYFNRNEGISPTIFMYDFNKEPTYLIVDEPACIAGNYLTNVPSGGWGDGSYLTDVPVSGEVVVVNDGVEEPSTADACQDIINANELAGKIALIDRGACQFSFKALQAQNAGAIAVILCSADNKAFTIAAGPDAPNVHIPIVCMIAKQAATIRKYAGHGLKVTLVNPGESGLHRLDSDLENDMIAHEFGHGISIRLAGGPDKVCLDNAEQMGEGWSDFFALVTTVQPGDTGDKSRGLATYVERESPTENGFRRYPYSTNMNVTPLTYGAVAADQEKHALGEVWADMLWDMYWAMVNKYGWNADLYNESSGNYKAVRLVIDGLKNMACDPGFVDGRNAILAADSALYNGENTCLLWEVFARRGLGFSADEGSPYDAGDQKEAFDLPPVCGNKIDVKKSVTDFIQPGDDIQVIVKVGNYKTSTATNVKVNDEIPEGTTFQANSSNYPVVQQGNTLEFDLGNLNFKEEKIITYTLHSTPEVWSQRKFLDDVADANDSIWIVHTIGSAASNNWTIADTVSHSGNFSWMSAEAPEKSQQAMTLNPDVYSFHVEGDHPAMRFFHHFQTQAGINGGIVEVREVGTTAWNKVDADMIRNGYSGILDYRTFFTTDAGAFSGNSGDGFQATYVDLSAWSGKDIQVRFLFGTNPNAHGGAGWQIDDIEFMDLLSYNGEACVSTDQGDYECTTAPEKGTIVDSREEPLSGTETLRGFISKIYPNPATDKITLALSAEHPEEMNISLLTLDGKQLFDKSIHISGNDYVNINTSNVPSGFYLVKVSTAQGQYVDKVVIQK